MFFFIQLCKTDKLQLPLFSPIKASSKHSSSDYIIHVLAETHFHESLVFGIPGYQTYFMTLNEIVLSQAMIDDFNVITYITTFTSAQSQIVTRLAEMLSPASSVVQLGAKKEIPRRFLGVIPLFL